MNGEELLKYLKKLTPAQRKLPVVVSYWNNDDSGGSGWTEHKEPCSLRISVRSSWRSKEEILLLE